MTINFEYSVDHWRADIKELPGSPPIGTGATKEMAVACLFVRLLSSGPGPAGSGSWFDHIDLDSPLRVDGKLFKYPKSYGKR